MKRLILHELLLLFFLVSSSYSQSNWIWQNPLPQGNDLTSVKFINTSTGYSTGMSGTIVKTINGGTNWSLLQSNTSTDLFNLFLIDSLNVFAVGQGVVSSTTNGGLGWRIEVINPDINFTGIDFTSKSTGWISGFNNLTQRGVIFKTSNGGMNWVQNFISPSNDYFKSIRFINSSLGHAGGQGSLYRTTNGGINWNFITSNLYYQSDFLFYDSLSGIFTSNLSASIIAKTTNGGNNFTSFSYFGDTALNSICFVDSRTWFVAGNKGKILKSTNYGDNWFSLISNTSQDINSISFSGEFSGWAVGKSGIILNSTDQGNLWSSHFNVNGASFLRGQVLNQDVAFMSGQHGVVKTTNSGENWFTVWDGYCSESKFSIINFLNENTGWLCYPCGNKTYKTTDGGLNWTATGVFSMGSVDFYPKAMLFINEDIGFLVGRGLQWVAPGYQITSGFLLRSTNGGNSWAIYSLPSNSQGMNDIKFINSTTGILVGGNSSIVRTTNGGYNWFNAVSLFDSFLYSNICFIDENTGWLLGKTNSGTGSNKICKTTNGGLSWSNITGQVLNNINAFQFVDANNAWMCGDFGSVYASSNGGSNWIKQETPTNNALYALKFVNSNTGWIAGRSGTILKTTSGIMPVSVNQNESVVTDFILNQNYPNPFNPKTNITYTLRSIQVVKLKIYDIKGMEVSTLVNEKQNSGTYKVEFSGENLSSGVYFYKLETKTFTDTKKMILIK